MKSQRFTRTCMVYYELLDALPTLLAEKMTSVRSFFTRGIHDSKRAFARCLWKDDERSGRTVIIEIAVELENEPFKVIRGVLAHEFAHALMLMQEPMLSHDFTIDNDYDELDDLERRTDAVAEELFGQRIYYDDRMVQCMGRGAHGMHPRPKGLT